MKTSLPVTLIPKEISSSYGQRKRISWQLSGSGIMSIRRGCENHYKNKNHRGSDGVDQLNGFHCLAANAKEQQNTGNDTDSGNSNLKIQRELPRLKKSELRRAFRLCLRSLILCFRLIPQATLILTGVSTSPLLYRVSRPTTLLFLSIFSAPFISAFSTFPSLLL